MQLCTSFHLPLIICFTLLFCDPIASQVPDKCRISINKQDEPNVISAADNTLTSRSIRASQIDLANFPTPCDKEEGIAITLPNKTLNFKKHSTKEFEFNRTWNKATHNALNRTRSMPMFFWSGDNDDGGATFNFIRTSDEKIIGSIVDTDEDTVSHIRIQRNGTNVLITTPSSEFPPELEGIAATAPVVRPHPSESDARIQLRLEKPVGSGLYENRWKKCAWVLKQNCAKRCSIPEVGRKCPLTCSDCTHMNDNEPKTGGPPPSAYYEYLSNDDKVQMDDNGESIDIMVCNA